MFFFLMTLLAFVWLWLVCLKHREIQYILNGSKKFSLEREALSYLLIVITPTNSADVSAQFLIYCVDILFISNKLE